MNKGQKKERIMKTAIDLFIKKGYMNVTTREISKTANISTGLLYTYFQNKDELFKESVNWFTRLEILKHQKLVKEIDDPMEQLYESLRICARHFGKYQGLILLILDYILNTSDKDQIPDILGPGYKMVRDVDSKLITDGIKKGSLSKLNKTNLAIIIAAFVDGLIIQKKINPDIEVNEIMEMFIELIKSLFYK